MVKWIAGLSEEVVGWTMIFLSFSSYAVYAIIVDHDYIGPVFFTLPAVGVYTVILFGVWKMCKSRVKAAQKHEGTIRG